MTHDILFSLKLQYIAYITSSSSEMCVTISDEHRRCKAAVCSQTHMQKDQLIVCQLFYRYTRHKATTHYDVWQMHSSPSLQSPSISPSLSSSCVSCSCAAGTRSERSSCFSADRCVRGNRRPWNPRTSAWEWTHQHKWTLLVCKMQRGLTDLWDDLFFFIIIIIIRCSHHVRFSLVL